MTTTYKHLEIEDYVGEPTDSELKALEEKLEAKLPDVFVDFLKVANGGYLEYFVDIAIKQDKTEALCFCELYGTRDSIKGGAPIFSEEIDSERKYKNIPAAYLPFARDGGSSILYLDLAASGAGRVIAFIEGLPNWTGLNQSHIIVEVAKSFEEFANKLYLDPEV